MVIRPIYGNEKAIPPKELSLPAIKSIHAGLLIPNQEAILSMSRELLKWRGEPNPDLI